MYLSKRKVIKAFIQTYQVLADIYFCVQKIIQLCTQTELLELSNHCPNKIKFKTKLPTVTQFPNPPGMLYKHFRKFAL